MGQNNIMQLFFENPSTDFQIRGIAKELKISKTAVSHHINSFIKKKLVLKENKGVFPSFIANSTNELYRFYKKQYSIESIIKSGILDYIEMEINPQCIILFGSFGKGEYDYKSDIDLFVQSNDATLDLLKFEKKLKHKINILFEPELKKLSPELFNNILNGIKLRGYIKWKK